tara:strand:+ start:1083 stop:2450 length:1368 start_codon:yes stop_codon:yes gene_type:complete
MAVATGSQIRPELSAVNYTPYLQATGQAAQMIARGGENIGSALANLGQQAGNAIKDYKQNKEKEKQYQGVIKAADTLTKGYEGIIDRLNPRIATALTDLRSRITDPNISTVEKYSAAQSFLDNAPNLLNAGLKMADIESDSASKKAEINAKKAQFEREQRIKAVGISRALGQQDPVELTPDELNEALVFSAEVLKKGQTTERVDRIVNGKVVPTNVNTNLITGKTSESAIREAFATPDDVAKSESAKYFIEAGGKKLDKLNSELDSAESLNEFATQISDAIESGATTGLFASASGKLKNFMESTFGGDYGATAQRLFTKATGGATGVMIRGMYKGLGGMSNTDREAGEKTYGLIQDPKQALRYFIETAKMNKERLEQQIQYANELRDSGLSVDKIASKVDDMRRKAPPVSEIVKERLGIKVEPKTSGTPETNETKPGFDIPSPEAIAKELARRGL